MLTIASLSLVSAVKTYFFFKLRSFLSFAKISKIISKLSKFFVVFLIIFIKSCFPIDLLYYDSQICLKSIFSFRFFLS